MGIRIEQKGLAGLYGKAAVLAGRAQRAREQEQKAERQITRLQDIEAQKEAQQMQVEQQQNMRLLDAQLDLERYERAKRWDIDKMQLRSQIDFQRKEQLRLRKLDSADSAIQQIEKEVLAGRMSEQEAYPLKLKYEINKLGVDAPTSLLPTGDEGEGYGVRPYYLEPEFERDYPEIAEAKRKEVISGRRTGTVPYYLESSFISSYPEAARQAQESRGIFLSDEEFESLKVETPEASLINKQLDMGVRTEKQASPYSEYPDAFLEGGAWKVIRNGKKYRIED